MPAPPAGWEPAADPAHRLVLLLDALAVAAARFRTAALAAGGTAPVHRKRPAKPLMA